MKLIPCDKVPTKLVVDEEATAAAVASGCDILLLKHSHDESNKKIEDPLPIKNAKTDSNRS